MGSSGHTQGDSVGWGRIPGMSGTASDIQITDEYSLMAESEEELKTLLMKVKEETEKADVKLNIQKPR